LFSRKKQEKTTHYSPLIDILHILVFLLNPGKITNNYSRNIPFNKWKG